MSFPLASSRNSTVVVRIADGLFAGTLVNPLAVPFLVRHENHGIIVDGRRRIIKAKQPVHHRDDLTGRMKRGITDNLAAGQEHRSVRTSHGERGKLIEPPPGLVANLAGIQRFVMDVRRVATGSSCQSGQSVSRFLAASRR